ncbi:MAG: aromatic amino acid lyase [Klebsiella pneumoniae]|nr:aromatic amino acid lyase [Klebsiella pneumoniae]
MLQNSLSIRCIPQIRGAPTALAAFLISPDSGYSGMMIPPYVAAALAGDNRSLAGPVSIHTVSTCAGQEDHVSMWRLPPHA